MIKSKIVTVFLMLLLVLSISITSQDSVLAAEDELTIGVAMMNLEYPFFQDIVTGIEENAPDNVEIITNDANTNVSKQVSALENFVARGVDAIILNAVDGTGVTAGLEAAASRNIPVITLDMRIKKGEFETFVGSDNELGGELAARYALEKINLENEEKLDVVLLTNPLSTVAVQRINGFKDYLDSSLDDNEYEIVAEKSGDSRSSFMTLMEDILVSNDEIDVVFGYSAQSGLGAYDAVESANREDEIKVIGFDATDEEKQRIDEDTSYIASVIQYPEKLGEVSLEAALDAIEGEELPEEIPVEIGLYTQEGELFEEDLK